MDNDVAEAAQSEGDQRCRSNLSLIDRLIRASSAEHSDRIMIAGANRIDLLMDLLHLGFTRASCRAADGPHVGEPASDVLWIPSLDGEDKLQFTLKKLGRELRPEGILAIRVQSEIAASRAPQVSALLAAQGFTVESREVAANGDLFLRAYKRTAIHALRAA
jgi:hypothetical protein